MRLLALTLTLSLSLSLTSFSAQAYDEDTHFYATYAMARYAGIKHQVATKIALSAQWMDESFISDPMSMMFLGLSGIKKRRVLHFPADRYVGSFNAIAQQAIFMDYNDVPAPIRLIAKAVMKEIGYDPKQLDRVNILSEVEKDHRLATQLLMMGLKSGNLMQAAASLHVLEDSYAHAGTPAGEGHRGAWHWPDRPFSNPTKYFEMTNSVFQALAAIRLMLPTSALDCSVRTTDSGLANCATGAAQLQKAFAANEDVQKTIRFDVLKDAEYVRGTMKSVFQLASDKKIGYVNMTSQQIDSLIENAGINGSKNAYETLFDIVTKLTENYLKTGDGSLNIYAMIADIFQISNPTTDDIRELIRNYGVEDGLLVRTDSDAFKKFALHLSKSLLRWYVPRELNNDDHRQEAELDTDVKIGAKVIRCPRNIEMEIRVRNMQALIQKMFKVDIEMIPNNSKDEVGFAHEIWMAEDAAPKLTAKPRPGVEYVTFNLAEKNRWNHMIFHYLYPSLKEDDLKALVNVGAAAKEISDRVAEFFDNSEETDSWMRLEVRSAGAMMGEWGEIRKIILNLKPFAVNWLHDLTAEMKTKDNYKYHSVSFLADFKQAGVIKPFLSQADTWNENLMLNTKAVTTATSDSQIK